MVAIRIQSLNIPNEEWVMSNTEPNAETDWKRHGIRIIRSNELDEDTAQTCGMTRAEAISHARVGAQKLWAGTVVVHPNAKTGAHHHGDLESVIYIVLGRAWLIVWCGWGGGVGWFGWGGCVWFVGGAGGVFFFSFPPYVPHQELNAK